MAKKQYGVSTVDSYKPKSSLRLEGEHAEQVAEHPIGRKVKMTVHAIKTSHNMNSGMGMGGKKDHSAGYDISKIEMDDNEKTDKPTEGKAEGANNANMSPKAYSKHVKL